MESYLRIKLVQENLALAISLWAAAQRGVITAGLIPGRSEILTGSGQIVKVSTPLQLGDNTNLVRSLNNQIRGSLALSASNTHLVLSNVYANSPLEEGESDLRAARCSLYLIHHTLSHDMIRPVWRCPVEYRQRFEVSSVGFIFDATHLDGKEVFWDDFGGLPKYLDLLEYCKLRVASSTESLSSAFPILIDSQLEISPAAAGLAATAHPATAGPDAAAPVLAGATLAAEPVTARTVGTQQQLPIGESLTQGSDPAPLPGPFPDFRRRLRLSLRGGSSPRHDHRQ